MGERAFDERRDPRRGLAPCGVRLSVSAKARWLARVALVEVLVLVMAILLSYVHSNASDSDGWFLLDTGRRVSESGILRENPWSLVGGLKVVVQQWLHDVVLWRLYELGGFPLVRAWACVLALALCALAYAHCRLACTRTGRGLDVAHALGLMCLVVGALAGWETVRPSLWSCAMALGCMLACERHRATGKARWLCALPVIMLLHMQIHMSLAWLDVLVVLGYLLPEGMAEARSLLECLRNGGTECMSGLLRPRAAVLMAALAMVAAMPLNPYGIDGMLYLFRSFGAASYRSMIVEMLPVWRSDPLYVTLWLSLPVLLGLVLPTALSVWLGCLRIDLTVMGAVALAAGAMQVRNGWLCVMVGVVVWAQVLAHLPMRRGGTAPGDPVGDGSPSLGAGEERADMPGSSDPVAGLPSRHAPLALLAVSAALAAVLSASGVFAAAESFEAKDSALSPLLDAAEDADGDGEPVIYADMGTLNWLEWRGVRVLADARPELWEPAISGQPRHLWEELADSWLSLRDGGRSFGEYVSARGVEFVLLPDESGDRLGRYDGLEPMASSGGFTLWKVVGEVVPR